MDLADEDEDDEKVHARGGCLFLRLKNLALCFLVDKGISL